MPREDEEVLVWGVLLYSDDGKDRFVVSICVWYYLEFRPARVIWHDREGSNYKITHWMPLPKGPNEYEDWHSTCRECKKCVKAATGN